MQCTMEFYTLTNHFFLFDLSEVHQNQVLDFLDMLTIFLKKEV